MKLYTKKLIFALILCASVISTKAQVYSEDFDSGSCNTTFPAGWNPSPDWLIDDNQTTCSGGVAECNVAGSSGGSMLAGSDGSSSLETVVSASFIASGFTGLSVQWNGYRSTGAPTTTLEYSFDDVTYTVVAFTDVTTDDAWHALTPVSLPANTDNAPVVYLRWSYTGTNGGAFIAFDDIMVNGAAATIFYWNGGAPHLTSSWGVNLDGTGANPPNFTTASHVYNFYNTGATSFAPTLSANWTVSGGSVFINVGDGATRLTNLTIPSTSSLSLTGGTITVLNSSTLTLANTVFPAASQVVLSAGSTIDFAQTSTVTLYNKTYENLIISGGANKIQSGNTTVNGILNLASATSNFSMTNSSLQTLTLNGSITGAGSILTGNSRLAIGGTGAFGTINFGVGFTNRTVNRLTISRTSGGSIVLGSNLTVSGITSLTNGNVGLNGNTLILNGQITFPASSANGAFVGSTASTFSIGGAGTITNSVFFDQTSASTRALRDFTLNRSGATVTLGNALEIWGSITPTVGTVAAGPNLTLKSDGSNKGRVGPMGASGDLTSSGIGVTVETFATGGTTGWTTLGSAGVSGLTFTAWDDDIAITCPVCPDGSLSGFTSISAYNESAATGNFAAAAHYADITNITNAMTNGRGYWVYLGNGSSTTTDILLDINGSIAKGNLGNMNLTVTGGASPQNGWNLLANPYPSPISFTAVTSGNTGNIENTLYVWNPDLNGGNGDFATFTPSVGSVPAVGSGGVDDNIPMGQGFYVRATTACAFSPVESWKPVVHSTNDLLKTQATYPSSMFVLNLTGGGAKNFNTMAAINLNAAATNGFDNIWDAHHLSSGYGVAEIYTILSGENYRLNSVPPINGTMSFDVKVVSGTSGAYQITPIQISNMPAGACISLFDKFTNTTHDLRTGAYSFNFMDTTTVPRFRLNITLNQTTLSSSSSNALCTKNPNGKIIAQGTTVGPWNYVWKDGNNNIIKTSTNISTADTLKNLGADTYYVDVNTVGTCDNANASFNIMVTSQLPVAAFTSSADSIDINSSTPFVFTNTSVNASNYTWYFGDGNTSTVTSPTYSYSTTGDYNVALYAVNPTCGDSSNFNYFVKVYSTATSPTLQSVASIAASDNNIKIGKDANGIYVQFNYDKNTKGTVTVTNVLGQVLVAPKTIEGTTERFYIDVNVKDQLLFVTVIAGEKRITERLISTR